MLRGAPRPAPRPAAPPRLLKSAGFRFALLFVGIFSVAAGFLVAVLWWATAGALDRQTIAARVAMALHQGGGVGADGGDGLAVERAGRGPPQHRHQEAGGDGENADEEQREAESRRFQQPRRGRRPGARPGGAAQHP